MLLFTIISLLVVAVQGGAAPLPSILDTVVANFTGLVTLTNLGGVNVSALGEPGNFTLFAPSDMAVAAVTAPSGDGAPDLTQIVFSHVLAITVNSTAVLSLVGPLVLTPLSLLPIRLNIYSGAGFSGAICINSAQVTVPDFGGPQSNGIIHEVDEVIIPAWRTFADIATAASLTKLLAVITKIDNDTVNAIVSETNVTEQAYTIFAPTDAAFEALEDALNISDITDAPTEILLLVILEHVVPNAYYSKAFTTSPVTAGTLSGQDVSIVVTDIPSVTVSSSGGSVATVTGPDVTAFNGVAHVIDTVLLPLLPDENVTDATTSETTTATGTGTSDGGNATATGTGNATATGTGNATTTGTGNATATGPTTADPTDTNTKTSATGTGPTTADPTDTNTKTSAADTTSKATTSADKTSSQPAGTDGSEDSSSSHLFVSFVALAAALFN